MSTTDLDHLGHIDDWRAHGYTGKGVTVWVMEGWTNHSRSCRRRVTEAAPDATAIIASPGRSMKNGRITSYNVYEYDKNGNKSEAVPVEEFIRSRNVRVITSSTLPDSFGRSGTALGDYWQDLIDKYDLCVFCCSGNESDKDKDFRKHVAWKVGALLMRGGKPIRASYSNGGEGLDFVESVGWWSGTSSATPFLAGKCALIQQRYPKMTHNEIYDYMVQNCQDLGDAGEDPLYGHGVFVFPEVGEAPKGDDDVEITKTKVLVDDKIIEVKRVMVNNENYIRLRDMEDVLGICDVDYDAEKNLPIVRKG